MITSRVLHVLPHAGGGGETYLTALDGVPGFESDRLELTRRGRPYEVPIGQARLAQAAHHHDLLHIHGDSAGLSCLPVIGRRPTVISLHGCHLLRRSEGVKGRIVRAGMRRAFLRAATVIAVSESEQALARRVAPAETEVVLIHNGIGEAEPVSESERNRVRESLGLWPESVACLFLGELSERKQPVEFADAIAYARAQNPAVVGLVAGDGPLHTAVQAGAGEGLRVLGQRNDPHELLAACDVFVLPSKWEGLSYAVLEAMSLGRATVVSDGPGNPDAVGDAGLIFPLGDAAAMGAHIARLAGDPGLRESLGGAARDRARERFSLAAMRDGTARVYERALRRSGA